MLFSRCGSRTGVQNSAKDSDSPLSRSVVPRKAPNKRKLSSQRKRNAPSKKHDFRTSALVASALPRTRRLVSRLRVGWVLRLLSNRLHSENSTRVQAFSLLLRLSPLPSSPSCSLTAVRQTRCWCVNVTTLGYTLNPWRVHVWTCSCTAQKNKPCWASYQHEEKNRCSWVVLQPREKVHNRAVVFVNGPLTRVFTHLLRAHNVVGVFLKHFFLKINTHFIFAWCKKNNNKKNTVGLRLFWKVLAPYKTCATWLNICLGVYW